ncbi:uncharacterized protein EV154DRAFT_402468, partial [Mucor mucedo]|uniref:uncharacterized protein n=1 Tax=Mucor mucedo TaxID=29922 RepID=UPI0022208CCC
FARALGFERLLLLPAKRVETALKENASTSPPTNVEVFPAGTHVLKRRINKSSKLDSGWEDEVFVVVAAFKNNT